MTQHFVQGQISYSAFLTRFIAKNKNVSCTHIVIELVADMDNISYFSSKYSIDFDDNDGSFQFRFEEINESQMFIGYLDVRNKEFVFNRKFDPKHFLKDNLRSMVFTLDDQLLGLIHGPSGKKV